MQDGAQCVVNKRPGLDRSAGTLWLWAVESPRSEAAPRRCTINGDATLVWQCLYRVWCSMQPSTMHKQSCVLPHAVHSALEGARARSPPTGTTGPRFPLFSVPGVHFSGSRRFLRDVCADTALEVHVFTAGMELYASPLLDTCARRAIVCNVACLRLQQGATYRVPAALHVLRPLHRSMQRHCVDST